MREVLSSRIKKVDFYEKSNVLYVLQSNHLFHKYNWCHVIDTAPQLYMIVSLGTKLKSMSMRSWRWTSLHLPRANLSFVLTYVMTDAYGSLHFSAIFSASVLLTLVPSLHLL